MAFKKIALLFALLWIAACSDGESDEKAFMRLIEDDEDSSLMDFFNSKIAEDPLDTITKKEYYKLVGDKIDENLSSFEKKVLSRYIAGESYVKIAEKLDAPVKSIDNAIQRIRKKASKNIMNED